jgi:hypothetical protein
MAFSALLIGIYRQYQSNLNQPYARGKKRGEAARANGFEIPKRVSSSPCSEIGPSSLKK